MPLVYFRHEEITSGDNERESGLFPTNVMGKYIWTLHVRVSDKDDNFDEIE